MADFTQYKISLGEVGTSYADKHDNFIDASETYATEIENAREGEATVVANLQNNYIKYILQANINGGSTYKCTNMLPADDNQDYITLLQAQTLAGGASTPQDLNSVGVGSMQPNDVLVIEPNGSYITKRSSTYTTVPTTCVANGNYDMELSGGSRSTTLPTGTAGMVISFADIGGNIIESTRYLDITSAVGQTIMGIGTSADVLRIDAYPYCSFDLVYINTAFGWSLARMQR